MASACVNQITMSPEKFLDRPATLPWLTPRNPKSASRSSPAPALLAPEKLDLGDFEFCLEDPVNIIPADELFSNGKLRTEPKPKPRSYSEPEGTEPRLVENPKVCRKLEILNTDPYLFSPRAPRCSSRWKDLLGLKKFNITSNASNSNTKTSSNVPSRNSTSSSISTNSSNSSNGTSAKSLKMFLHRSSKSTGSNVESAPLLPEEFVASARLSLSSSSSGSYDRDTDLPRHSLDLDKFRNGSQNPPRVRLSRHRTVSSENPVPTRMSRSSVRKSFDLSNANNGTVRGISVDSPRMNASGRVIFQGLERSSSSPSSLNGGPRLKYKGMERSYSANVRVTPVLNVPVCSLMGSSKSSVFGFQIFPNNVQKSGGAGGGSRGHVSKVRIEKS